MIGADKISIYLLNLSPFKPAANIIPTVLQDSVIAIGGISIPKHGCGIDM